MTQPAATAGSSEQAPSRSFFGKYTAITLSIIVLIAILVGILSANAYLGLKQSNYTVQIDSAGEASDATYNLNLAIHRIAVAAYADGKFDNIKDVQATARTIDQNLSLLENGGQYVHLDLNRPMQPIGLAQSRQNLQAVKKLWTEYRQRLTILDNIDPANVTPAQAAQLKDLALYAEDKKDPLYDGIDKIIVELTDNSQEIGTYLTYLQITGFAFLILYFLTFVFYFLRQMRRADAVLEEARQETKDILDNVADGLFLLNPDMSIGSQHSKALEKILGNERISGRDFPGMVGDMLTSEQKRESLHMFVEQLYNPRVVEKLIKNLNPLRQVEIAPDKTAKDQGMRTLSFHFSRVFKNKQVNKILVNVEDITQKIRLEQRLEKMQQENDAQVEMISEILNSDLSLLSAFLHESQQKLNQINNILKQPGTEQSELRDKTHAIARLIHSVKGEASALKLKLIVAQAESFEDTCKTLKTKPELSGEDFLPLTVKLEQLLNVLGKLQALFGRLSGLSQTLAGADKAASGPNLEAFFNDFVGDIARRNHKKVVLHTEGLELLNSSHPQFALLKDVMIQLLRNAVVHGVEAPAEREARGKSAQGHIRLALRPAGNSYEIRIEDDGKGIDFEAIRRRAVERGLADAAALRTWSDKEVLGLIFRPGFSTLDSANEDGGRGVGMDIIKENIQKINGKLAIQTAPHEFTRFAVTFPHSSDSRKTHHA